MSSPSWGLKAVGNREISREIRFESPSDTCAHRHGKHSAGVAEAQDQLGIAIEFKPLDEAGTNFMQVERLGETDATSLRVIALSQTRCIAEPARKWSRRVSSEVG